MDGCTYLVQGVPRLKDDGWEEEQEERIRIKSLLILEEGEG